MKLGGQSRFSRRHILAEELEKSRPTNTILKLYRLPTVNAVIELTNGNSSWDFSPLVVSRVLKMLDSRGISVNEVGLACFGTESPITRAFFLTSLFYGTN